MPRYLVERSFPDGFQIPVDASGVRACLAMMDCNLLERVSWLQSYVSVDKRRTYCIYDGPSPEAIRRAAIATSCRFTKSPKSACWILTSIFRSAVVLIKQHHAK